MYQAPIWELLSVRGPKNLIMWPIEAAISFLILRAVSRLDSRLMH